MNIGWIEEWRAIDGMITAYRAMVELGLRSPKGGAYNPLDFISSSDWESLRKEIRSRLDELLKSGTVQADVRQLLRDFGSEPPGPRDFTRLLVLSTRVNYILSDRRRARRMLMDRALIHLQSRMAVDQNYRKLWLEAYEKKRGEEACEQLGAVHCLLHGIWCKKVQGASGVTDLIASTRGLAIPPGLSVDDIADAQVLTEWKHAEKARNLEKAFDRGMEQAKLYSEGVAVGMGLQPDRYVIAVAKSVPPSCKRESYEEEGVTYHFRAISVEPQSPSKAARAKSPVL